jgi:hypothetical protein
VVSDHFARRRRTSSTGDESAAPPPSTALLQSIGDPFREVVRGVLEHGLACSLLRQREVGPRSSLRHRDVDERTAALLDAQELEEDRAVANIVPPRGSVQLSSTRPPSRFSPTQMPASQRSDSTPAGSLDGTAGLSRLELAVGPAQPVGPETAASAIIRALHTVPTATACRRMLTT